MEDRIFIQYLATFSSTELRKFHNNSLQEFKKKQDKLALSYLVNSRLDNYKADEDTLAELLLANSTNRIRVIKKFFSNCMQVIEDHLVGQELRKEEYKLFRNAILLRRLKKHKEENLFLHSLKKAAKTDQKEDLSSALPLISSLLLTHEAFFHPMFDGKKLPSKSSFVNYAKQIDKLEKAATLLKYKFSLAEMVRNRLEKNQANSLDVDHIIHQEERFSIEEFPILHTYRLSITLFDKFDENTYQQFKEQVKDIIIAKRVLEEEQEALFRLLVNHTAQAIRFDKKYLEDGLDNYRFGITHNMLTQSGYLPQEHFFNYVTLSCSFGRVQTASRFIDDFQNKLMGSKRQQVVLISEALVLMAKKQFKAAYNLLENKNFRDPHLRLMARSNRLMLCYDWEYQNIENIKNVKISDDWVSLKDEMESYKRVIIRLKSILGSKNERIIANENFIKMIRSLEKANSQIKPSKSKLKHELEKHKIMACRKWLEQKIEEF